jgi:hypothetical protein
LSTELQAQGLKLSEAEVVLANRADVRLAYTRLREQHSVETVVREAIGVAEKLGPQENPPKDLDSDWLIRLFDHAKHVTHADMLKLWGRVLALEARAPGTYSLRALDALSTMSRAEAEAFDRLATCAYETEDGRCGVLVQIGRRSNRFIAEKDLHVLASTGLLLFEDGLIGSLRLRSIDGVARCRIGGVAVKITSTGGRGSILTDDGHRGDCCRSSGKPALPRVRD